MAYPHAEVGPFRLGGHLLARRPHACRKNGTFLRGARLAEPAPLADGESFRLGDEAMTLRKYTGAPTATGREPSGA